MNEQKLIAWFQKLAKKNGWHPRTVVLSPKVLAEGKVNADDVSEDVLTRAVRECLAGAKHHAAENNTLYGRGKRPSYIDVDEREWLSYLAPEPQPPIELTGGGMKIPFAEAVTLLGALGFMGVRRWPAQQVRERVCNLDREHVNGAIVRQLTATQKQLYDDALAAIAERRAVQVVEPPATNGNGHAPKRAPQPAKTGPRTAQPPRNRVGITATIIACLKAANAKQPTTLDKIHAVLVSKFPDRASGGMKTTVGCQVRHHLPAKGLDIQNDGNGGYWLEEE